MYLLLPSFSHLSYDFEQLQYVEKNFCSERFIFERFSSTWTEVFLFDYESFCYTS